MRLLAARYRKISSVLSNGRTITWVPTAHHAWLATMKKNRDVLETFAVTLSGNIFAARCGGNCLTARLTKERSPIGARGGATTNS